MNAPNRARRAAAAAMIAATGCSLASAVNAAHINPESSATSAISSAPLALRTPTLLKSGFHTTAALHYGLLFGGSYNGHAYFYAGYADQGIEPWVTDGTSVGTSLIDLNPGPGDAPFNYYFNVSGVQQQTATNWGNQLWATDGTGTGSTPIFDRPPTLLLPQKYSKYFGHPDKLVFYTLPQTSQPDFETLFATDLTPTGTLALSNDALQIYTSTHFLEHGDALYFSDRNFSIKRISGATGDIETLSFTDDYRSLSNFSRLIPLGTQILTRGAGYTSTGAYTGYEPVAIDTSTGTISILRDIFPGSSSHPQDMVRVGDYILFSAVSAESGRELWRTDGTSDGTVQVTELTPNTSDGVAPGMTAFGGRAIFTGLTGENSQAELWASDGSEEGTTRLLTSDDLPSSYFINEMINHDTGILFLVGDEGYHARYQDSLWYTDGTSGGSYKIADIGMIVSDYLLLKDKLLFLTEGQESENSAELWAIDLNTPDFAQLRLDLILSNFGTAAYGDEIIPGDVTGDGKTDINDLNWVLRNWPGGEPPDFNVPEPGACAMLTLGGLLLTRRRR